MTKLTNLEKERAYNIFEINVGYGYSIETVIKMLAELYEMSIQEVKDMLEAEGYFL